MYLSNGLNTCVFYLAYKLLITTVSILKKTFNNNLNLEVEIMIKKGTWVEIEENELMPEDRATNIPDETKKTPLNSWTRGKCLSDSELGIEVQVETNIGRIAKGTIVEIEPGYYHTYGKYVEEISNIIKQAKEIIGQ
jgi:hypothetical protein